MCLPLKGATEPTCVYDTAEAGPSSLNRDANNTTTCDLLLENAHRILVAVVRSLAVSRFAGPTSRDERTAAE